MILLVDIGNSRVKWSRADGRAPGDIAAFARTVDDLGIVLEQEWHRLRVDRVVCCSVAGREPVDCVRRWAERAGLAGVEVLDAAVGTGVLSTAYRDPARLGADRWANLLGARRACPAADAVIVDAGTAVTVDALRADGHHVGGAIFAGLATGRAALRAAAPALPADVGAARLPAVDTASAVGGGTLVGLAGAIERVAGEVGAGLERPRCLLTGGDAACLQPLLGEHWIVDPALTMRGLLAFAETSCAG